MIIGTPTKSANRDNDATRLCLGILCFFCFVTTASATNTGSAANNGVDSWTLQGLMDAMSEVKSSSAHFDLEEHRSITTKPLVSSGKLVYRAPDYIERRTEKPLPGYFIVEKNNLRIKTQGQKEHRLVLYQFPPIHALVEAMRATLAGNAKTLKQFYQVSFSGSRSNWTLKLKPTDEEMQDYVETMTFYGSNTQLLRVETLEAGGDRSIMKVSRHSD